MTVFSSCGCAGEAFPRLFQRPARANNSARILAAPVVLAGGHQFAR
jgi:hypothetical protein